MERDRMGGIDILYSPRGIKADEVIKEMVLRAGEEIMVVTSDRDVANFVNRRGGTAVSSSEFETYLVERRRKEPKEEEEDTRGKKKKGPARRLSRKERLYRQRLAKL